MNIDIFVCVNFHEFTKLPLHGMITFHVVYIFAHIFATRISGKHVHRKTVDAHSSIWTGLSCDGSYDDKLTPD